MTVVESYLAAVDSEGNEESEGTVFPQLIAHPRLVAHCDID